jgi:hypothetical protein
LPSPQLGKFLDGLIVSLSKISLDCQQFSDGCVLAGLVPPHPGDVQRALAAPPPARGAAPAPEAAEPPRPPRPHAPKRPSDQIKRVTGPVPALADAQKERITAFLRCAKNPLSLGTLERVRAIIPDLPMRDVRNCVRMLMQEHGIGLD